MWFWLLGAVAWGGGVEIAVSGPGEVRVSATEGPVYVAACRGVQWELFNTNTNSLPCGNIDSSGGIQRICIQKDISQVTMLCHVGNTLQ